MIGRYFNNLFNPFTVKSEKPDKLLETLTGAAVLALAIGFCIYAYVAGGQRTPEGYRLIAKFDRVDGLKRDSQPCESCQM